MICLSMFHFQLEEGFTLLRNAFTKTLIADEDIACILYVLEFFCPDMHTLKH